MQGWSVYSVVWDKDANRGKGDVSIKRAKLLNLYWDMEVDDLNASSDVFYLHEMYRDELVREYPGFERDIIAMEGDYERHDEAETSGLQTKVTVVDWYYKKRNKEGKRILHLCQFVGNVILYATENEKEFADRGKLGCDNCYSTFKKYLTPVLKRIHGAGSHSGKIPVRSGDRLAVKRRLDSLRVKLKEAVAAEEYEKAAEYRDMIRAMEQEKGEV